MGCGVLLNFVLGQTGGKAHLAGTFLVKHAVGHVAFIAQATLAVVERDMDGVVVAHVARQSSAQGDLGVTGGNGTAVFDFKFGGYTGALQAA